MSKLDTEKILHNSNYSGNKIINVNTDTESQTTLKEKAVANVEFVRESLKYENEKFTKNIAIGTNTITHTLSSFYITAFLTISQQKSSLPITIIDADTISFQSSLEITGAEITLHKNSFKS